MSEIVLDSPIVTSSANIKQRKPVESALLNDKITSFDKIEELEEYMEENNENDWEVTIDQIHYDLSKNPSNIIKNNYPSSNFSLKPLPSAKNLSHDPLSNNSFFNQKTPSLMTIDQPNNFLLPLQTNSKFHTKQKLEEISYSTKWSMLLSKRFFRILKKPIKLMKSEIISPYLVEKFIKTYGTIIRIMEKGDAIGEKALVENNPRSATVSTITPCEFLILEKKDLKIIKDEFEGVLLRRTEFLIEALKLNQQSFSSKVKENMLYSFSVEKFKKDALVTNQGNSDLRFYLIEEGEVIIEKTLIIEESIKGHKEFFNKKPEKLSLCISGRGSFLGEEILFNNDSNIYEYTSKVISNEANVLVVNKNIFFAKFPSEIRQVLFLKYHTKNINRRKLMMQLLSQKKLHSNFNSNSKTNLTGNQTNAATDIFYSRGVNVYNLLQKSCYDSFDKNIKRVINPLEQSNSNKNTESLEYSQEREKFAKYIIGPRSKCKYIKNTISFPRTRKIFNVSPSEKSNKKLKTPNNLKILQLSKTKIDFNNIERNVIRKGEDNQPMIDVEMLLSYSEDFLKRNNDRKTVSKLDFGEEEEVRFKYFRPQDGLGLNYLRTMNKNERLRETVKRISGEGEKIKRRIDGEGVYVNYSQTSFDKVKFENETNNRKIQLDELSHMNSTYNFSNLKRNLNNKNPLKGMRGNSEGCSLNHELLKESLQIFNVEKAKLNPILDNLELRVHENLNHYIENNKGIKANLHHLRLLRKYKERKQIGKKVNLG